MPTRPRPASQPDAPLLPSATALKGRGTVWAIEHRFTQQSTEAYDDGWGTLDQRASEEHLPPATQIIEERVKSIVSSNDSPDISFDLSINPYRGCEHVMWNSRRELETGFQPVPIVPLCFHLLICCALSKCS